MIIHRLMAENILKYQRIELDNLPQRGLFAVSGENESGKSSIGEILCFALFGRTFSVDQVRVEKVIRWGELRGRAELHFTDRDGNRCRIERQIDHEGNHGVVLEVASEPMVRGIDPVSERMLTAIGFGYEEFIESYYLAQREMTSPHPHSQAVKTIAGLAPLEDVAATMVEEIRRERVSIASIEQEIISVGEQISDLGIVDGHLRSLEQQQESLRGEQEEQSELITEWRSVPGLCEESRSEIAGQLQPLHNDQLHSVAEWRQWHATTLELLSGVREEYAEAVQIRNAVERLEERVNRVGSALNGYDALAGDINRLRERVNGELAEESNEQSAAVEEEGAPIAPRIAALQLEEGQLASSRGSNRLLMLLALILSLTGGALYWQLQIAPGGGVGAEAILATIEQALSTPRSEWHHLLGAIPYITGGALLLLLITIARTLSIAGRINDRLERRERLQQRIEQALEERRELERLDQQPLGATIEWLQQVAGEEFAVSLTAFRNGSGSTLLEPELLATFRGEVKGVELEISTAYTELANSALQEVTTLAEALSANHRTLSQLEEAIEIERNRCRHAEDLNSLLTQLPVRIAEHQERIAIREVACSLLSGALRFTTQRFNRDIRTLVARILPVFTDGRYQHLQVDESLQVRVFSAEKQDFLDLDEISSGTQRQIMLALRLAFTHALARSARLGPQFIFLDEPFAFFDQQRTIKTLERLAELGESFGQVWVISQEFPAESRFDLTIHCERACTEMVLDAGAAD